ncbi:helix-turn-helix domain-containing protein [Anaeroselena agilis]|uniref:Helix-turn-helix domain-containing protein n=1 Tax=Anaeroselena agilis TaxID=3063788 RepID=A0ABU3NZL2_9FIRM|nr:helix-turn-helix domain-containing protein [Selenomonadales bacterium 4137-cl]
MVIPKPDKICADDLLNAIQTAKLLGVSKDTIYELTRRKEIPHRYVGKQPRYPVWLIIDWFHNWKGVC